MEPYAYVVWAVLDLLRMVDDLTYSLRLDSGFFYSTALNVYDKEVNVQFE